MPAQLSAPEAPRTVSPPALGSVERTALGAAVLAGVLAPLNSTMIVVALPELLVDLRAPLTWGSWIVVSYLVAMAAVQPLGGSLGDRFGRRRLMLVGLTGFAAASVLAALAWRVEVLVLARTVQAVAGASAIPNGTALVRTLVTQARQGRAFGVVGAGIGVAAALGPPLGGFVTDAFGWRWIFAANLVVLLPGLVLVARLPARMSPRTRGRFDLLGSGLLLGTFVAAALAATVWRVPAVPTLVAPGLAAFALASGAWFVAHTRRTATPVLRLALLARPGFLPAGLTVGTSNLVMYTVFVALPLFLAHRVGWGTRDVGLVLGGMSLAMLVCGPLGGVLADRLGPRPPALAGMLLTLAGALPFVALTPTWPWWAYLGSLVVLGTGIGLASAPIQTAAMRAAPPGEAGQAAGLYSTMRYAGSIAGTAMLAAVLGDASEAGAFRLLFLVVTLVALAAVASAARLPAA
jgi:EmrB/QacA subfamily drug resistance transporter